MGKKQYFLIIDTETTKDDNVADFGAVICDRNGVIYKDCAVLIQGQFGEKELYWDESKAWTFEFAKRREANYMAMLNAGTRQLATVNAVNRWLDKARVTYNPILTAYNLAFDIGKCRNTGIDISGFSDRFCLWAAAAGNICLTKPYKQFALENHLFTDRTQRGNMSIKTGAESVAGFVTGSLIQEPHTAIEDARDFELPILKHIVAKRKWRDNIKPYAWQGFQVKDHYKVK